MFEIEGHKSTLIGLALGGISGFIFHKNMKLSKGYGIAVGSVLGLIVGFQFTKAEAKKNRELSERVRNMEAIDQRNKMISEGKMTPSGDKNVKSYPKVYSKECYDKLTRRLQDEDVKPPNFEKDFLETCSKLRSEHFRSGI